MCNALTTLDYLHDMIVDDSVTDEYEIPSIPSYLSSRNKNNIGNYLNSNYQ